MTFSKSRVHLLLSRDTLLPQLKFTPHLLKMMSYLNAFLRNSMSYLSSTTAPHLIFPPVTSLYHITPTPSAWQHPELPSQFLGPFTHFATRHLPNLSRTIVTTADMELLAWAWAMPAEKPSIWALTLVRLLAQTPGIRKVPWASLVATVPGQSRKETLAPSSGRPDGVTTEPRRM